MPSRVNHVNKTTGVTYVYESVSYWDKEKKQSRNKQVCVGKLDPPKVAVSKLVNSLKGVSSRLIRKKNYPDLRKKLWGGALWSPSYFASSCGGAPINIIRQYIEQQQAPS